jgi:hypothetical protein
MAIRMKKSGRTSKWLVVALLVGVAFFGSYAFAAAKGAANKAPAGDTVGSLPAATSAAATGAAAGGAGNCCGTGGAGAASAPVAGAQSGAGGCCGTGAAAPASAQVPKAAEMAGGVQKISVDVSKGYYDPSVIELAAGVPAEITFSQASGCTGYVQSADLGFSEDLSTGPKTVKLAGLQPGTYAFACGMNMVFGSVVVK